MQTWGGGQLCIFTLVHLLGGSRFGGRRLSGVGFNVEGPKADRRIYKMLWEGRESTKMRIQTIFNKLEIFSDHESCSSCEARPLAFFFVLNCNWL